VGAWERTGKMYTPLPSPECHLDPSSLSRHRHRPQSPSLCTADNVESLEYISSDGREDGEIPRAIEARAYTLRDHVPPSEPWIPEIKS
jgi:hypothetical protein